MDEAVSMNNPDPNSITICQRLVVEKGDIDAYQRLSIMYFDNQYCQDILYYSLIMANQYNYTGAYYDVFFYLFIGYTQKVTKIEPYTADLAINYLMKAYDRKHEEAVLIVEEYHIKYDEKTNREQLINFIRLKLGSNITDSIVKIKKE
jgi:TPR repeat protein